LSKIISIGTAVPKYRHQQKDILSFMQKVYALDATEQRKLSFLYKQSGINERYSVIADYSREVASWKFYPKGEGLEPFPTLEQRMEVYQKFAAPLSVNAIRNCMEGVGNTHDITHLITVSCTGMSAPGLDLEVMELLDLPKNIFRTSVNFMGCYAAIHGLKIADAICKTERNAKIMVVCTELCTLHFQKEATADNIASSLLFADGAAAALITHNDYAQAGYTINGFYAEVASKGKKDMSWELSGNGFLMTLSGYVPDLIKEDFHLLVQRALQHYGEQINDIDAWCIHPGGKRILEAISKSLALQNGDLENSYHVLQQYGNMSSATILFVLKQLMQQKKKKVMGAAFGPGLTMETLLLQPAL
jgi:predicted naringenin-chalcone synthase